MEPKLTYYQRHKEKLKAYQRQYYATMPDVLKKRKVEMNNAYRRNKKKSTQIR